MTKTILVLASNPRGTTVLDLSREIRDIEEGLKRSQNRDQFKIEILITKLFLRYFELNPN